MIAPADSAAWYRKFWLRVALAGVVLYLAAPWYWAMVWRALG